MPATIEEGTAVAVRIVQDDTANLQHPEEKPKEKVITTNSFLMSVGAPPVPILNHSPKRCVAQVIVNGNAGDVVALGKTASDCQAAATAAAGEYIGSVVYILASFGAPIPFEGTSELYASLVVAGAAPVVISVIKETYTSPKS
jgi:hypothetical protein